MNANGNKGVPAVKSGKRGETKKATSVSCKPQADRDREEQSRQRD